jgi:16S rRNA (guanine(966)-N(2))-methyltransferase RsmD
MSPDPRLNAWREDLADARLRGVAAAPCYVEGRAARIIAGRGKGRRLKTPGGLETRPTGGRVKQTLFDILAPVLPGCRFLDAFAGAGGIGLEARSRGASKVVLVDVSAAAVAAIKENVRALEALGGEEGVGNTATDDQNGRTTFHWEDRPEGKLSSQ